MLENYEDILDVTDVCRILRIERKLAYKLIRNGEIFAIKVGYRYRIPKFELIRFIRGERKQSVV